MPHAPGATAVWTTYNYDVMGRTTSVTAPDGSATTYAYAGNTLTVTDPAGKWKKYTNNAFGNLVEVVEPKDANNTYTTTYTYDAFNKLTLVTMPRDGVTQTRTFVYDSAQQLQSVTNPESGTTTYSHTPYGRLEYKVDAAGIRVEYSYDTYNRLTQKRQCAPPGSVEDTCRRVDYYWDQNSFDTPQYWGKLTAVKYGGVTCRAGQFIELYRYSSAGLTTRKEIRYSKRRDLGNGSYWDAPGTLVGTFEYNNEGVLTALTYPNGERYYYALDSMSRPTKVTNDVLANDGNRYPTDWAKDAVYGVAGELTQWKHAGGGIVDTMDHPNFLYYTETRQYNNRLQMTRLTATHPFGPWLPVLLYCFVSFCAYAQRSVSCGGIVDQSITIDAKLWSLEHAKDVARWEARRHTGSKMFRLTMGTDRNEVARSLGFWMIDRAPYAAAVEAMRTYGYPRGPLTQLIVRDQDAVFLTSADGGSRTLLFGSRDPTQFTVAGRRFTLLHFAVRPATLPGRACNLLLYFLATSPLETASVRNLAVLTHKLYPTFDIEVHAKEDTWFFGQGYPDVYRFLPPGDFPDEATVDRSPIVSCTVSPQQLKCSCQNMVGCIAPQPPARTATGR